MSQPASAAAKAAYARSGTSHSVRLVDAISNAAAQNGSTPVTIAASAAW
jgi:hypothetical protein